MNYNRSKCSKCDNYVGNRCRLAAYEPCDFVPKKESDIVLYLKIIAIPVILFALLMLISWCVK